MTDLRNIDPRSQRQIDHEHRMATIQSLSLLMGVHGSWHPAVWAALGRAFVHWKSFVRPKHPDFDPELAKLTAEQWCKLQERLNNAYTTAQLREMGTSGCNNRRYRRFFNRGRR